MGKGDASVYVRRACEGGGKKPKKKFAVP